MIPVPGAAARLYCAICLFSRAGTADDADTIIAGSAVCYDHMGLLADVSPQLSRAVALAKAAANDGSPKADL